MARYNLIATKYHQMAFRSPSDGALISPNQQSFETPCQTKVSGDRQRETTHEICCLLAEWKTFAGFVHWVQLSTFIEIPAQKIGLI